ncbi:MAG: IMP dehydrogenase [Acidilobaceae archaeon]|nr:IMP dehydrogenase [Acidilobaceae archaeon]
MREYLTFDDVAIAPGLATVEPSEVELTTKASKNVELYLPFLSSPMDTVTEWRMAASLARLGALGVIHRNMSAESQALQVKMVKSAPQSPWLEVLKAKEDEPLDSLLFRMEEAGIGAAIVFSSPPTIVVSSAADQEFWFHKASAFLSLLREHKPLPLLDEEGRLRVGAAISPFDERRAKLLDGAGADVLVLDVAHAHNVNVLSSVARIAKEVRADVVVGNLGSRSGVLDAVARVENIAGLRMGIGSGSICSTAEVTGAFAPTLTAVMEARKALEELGVHGKIPIIADGGMRGAGDVAKALIAGASAAMLGRVFAGAEEAPGAKIRVGSRVYKQYRGMASRGAMERRFAEDRYARPSKSIEEGVEGLVPYRGSVVAILAELVSGLKAALGYAGAHSIESAWRGELVRVTAAAKEEQRPHDILL